MTDTQAQFKEFKKGSFSFTLLLFMDMFNGKAHSSSSIGLMNGYPTFVISILMIGLNTAVIGDVAGHLGCFIYLKDTVNAIAFVALGTSVPGKNNKT